MEAIKTIYGIHSVTLLDYETWEPKVVLKALAGANLELTGESVKLTGGSSLFNLDSEVSGISSEFSMTCREYHGAAMAILLAGTRTQFAANAAGQIVGKANITGESGDDVTVGLTSGSSADLKPGTYIVKFTGAATVALYAMSDIEGGEFSDDDILEIDDSITLSSSASDVLGYGFGLTAPATPAFVTGDAFMFTVLAPNMAGEKIKVGELASSFDDYAAIICAQKRGSGKRTWILVYRMKAYGMPVSFEEKKFSEWQVKAEILYDANQDGVFEFWRQG